jgi:hypothetical protein
MVRGRRTLGLALLLLAAVACSIGGSVAGWKPAGQAGGTDIELDLHGNRLIRGELLVVDSSSFLVLEAHRLVRVDFAAVRGGSAYKTSFDAPPISADTRERLRLMSRYPQGLPPGVEQQLLQAYGFSAVEQEL